MTTRSRVSASLVAALVSAAALLVPAPTASAAAGFTVATELPYNYPRQVPLATGQTTRLSVVVTSSEPVTVTARSYDGTLTIADPQRSLGTTPQPTTVSFDVAALTPGFHQLDVQVDGSTGPPFHSIAVGFTVWASGSPLPATASGAYRTRGKVYGYQAPGGPAQLLSFVSDDYAYLGLPAHGRPACTQEGEGCVRYWVEPSPSSGVVQIGTSIVGAFHRGGFYTDGFVPAGPSTGTPYGRHDFINPLYYVGSRNGMHGTYAYTDRSRTSGLTREKVTFLKYAGNLVGDYRLTYAHAGGRTRTLEGKFRVEKDGAITFRDARGRIVQRGTVLGTGRALPCAIRGVCRSGESGSNRDIWLILSGRKGNHPDGNLLHQVR